MTNLSQAEITRIVDARRWRAERHAAISPTHIPVAKALARCQAAQDVFNSIAADPDLAPAFGKAEAEYEKAQICLEKAVDDVFGEGMAQQIRDALA
jgi:hypothetical protein